MIPRTSHGGFRSARLPIGSMHIYIQNMFLHLFSIAVFVPTASNVCLGNSSEFLTLKDDQKPHSDPGRLWSCGNCYEPMLMDLGTLVFENDTLK